MGGFPIYTLLTMNVIFCQNFHFQPIIYVEIKVFDVQKKLYNLPELWGGGWGESIFFLGWFTTVEINKDGYGEMPERVGVHYS